MFDLQVLAMQGDITRVITFQLARETSNRTYPEIGVPDPHHPLSHHGNDPDKIARMAKINAFHVSLFAYYLEKLKATPEGDGTLLDHSLILYGSGMGNPNIHDHTNLPILVAGGGAGGMKGGRHLRYEEPTPLANLHLTLLERWACASTRSPTARARSTSCSRSETAGRMTLRRVGSAAAAVLLLHWRAGVGAAAVTRRWPMRRRAPDWTQVRTLADAARRRQRRQADGMTALHWAAYHDDLRSRSC